MSKMSRNFARPYPTGRPGVPEVTRRVFAYLMETVDLVAYMRGIEVEPDATMQLLNVLKCFADSVDFYLQAGKDLPTSDFRRYSRWVVRELELLAPRGEKVASYAPLARWVLRLLAEYIRWHRETDLP